MLLLFDAMLGVLGGAALGCWLLSELAPSGLSEGGNILFPGAALLPGGGGALLGGGFKDESAFVNSKTQLHKMRGKT